MWCGNAELSCKQELDYEQQERQRLAHELVKLADFVEGVGGRPGAMNKFVEDTQGDSMQMVMHDVVCVSNEITIQS